MSSEAAEPCCCWEPDVSPGGIGLENAKQGIGGKPLASLRLSLQPFGFSVSAEVFQLGCLPLNIQAWVFELVCLNLEP